MSHITTGKEKCTTKLSVVKNEILAELLHFYTTTMMKLTKTFWAPCYTVTQKFLEKECDVLDETSRLTLVNVLNNTERRIHSRDLKYIVRFLQIVLGQGASLEYLATKCVEMARLNDETEVYDYHKKTLNKLEELSPDEQSDVLMFFFEHFLPSLPDESGYFPLDLIQSLLQSKERLEIFKCIPADVLAGYSQNNQNSGSPYEFVNHFMEIEDLKEARRIAGCLTEKVWGQYERRPHPAHVLVLRLLPVEHQTEESAVAISHLLYNGVKSYFYKREASGEALFEVLKSFPSDQLLQLIQCVPLLISQKVCTFIETGQIIREFYKIPEDDRDDIASYLREYFCPLLMNSDYLNKHSVMLFIRVLANTPKHLRREFVERCIHEGDSVHDYIGSVLYIGSMIPFDQLTRQITEHILKLKIYDIEVKVLSRLSPEQLSNVLQHSEIDI